MPMIDEIYTLLGADTILLPYTAGRCLLTPEQLRTLTPAATRTPAYQRDLLANDIVVPCGKTNGGLCALVVHSVAAVLPMFDANPLLHDALATETPDGAVIWIRAVGVTPPTCRSESLSWLADDAVVIIRHAPPAQSGWSVIRSGGPALLKPIRLDLSADADLDEHFFGHGIHHRHGDPFVLLPQGGRRVNAGFWAAYAIRHLGIRFHPSTRLYDWLAPGRQQPSIVAPEYLAQQLGKLIFVATDGIQPHRASRDELLDVLEHLRIEAAVEEFDFLPAIEAFVRDRIVPQRFQSVTAEELLVAFEEFRVSLNLPPISAGCCLQHVGAVLARLHGTRASHSIIRGGRPHRGFRAISLRKTPLLAEAPQRDARDEPIVGDSKPQALLAAPAIPLHNLSITPSPKDLEVVQTQTNSNRPTTDNTYGHTHS